MNTPLIIFTIILILSIIILICIYQKTNKEKFQIVIGNRENIDTQIIDLPNFFIFMEYYMTHPEPSPIMCSIEGEYILVSNNIKNILITLNYIINSNEGDNFYNRLIIETDQNNYIEDNISVHDYYNSRNIEVNLPTLQKAIELINTNNNDSFSAIVRPTEHISFDRAFIIPMRSIMKSIYDISRTAIYKDYVYRVRYSRLV